jgi:3-carboxy-cis,cis-muconate cycloisomerase
MLDVELAWVRTQRSLGLVTDEVVAVVSAAAVADLHDVAHLAGQAESGGNPVIPMLTSLREEVRRRSSRTHDHSESVVATDAAAAVHRGLTSQDVVDTALMLVVSRAGRGLSHHLHGAADAMARLAEEHRDTLQVARTLGQPALPTTFGLKAAGWLGAFDDVIEELAGVLDALPVQLGGATGTLAAIEALAPGRSAEAASVLAGELGLTDPGRPWHTDRAPVTRVADGLVRAADAMGKVATDIATLSRAEIAELHEPALEGRGASSTLPQKRNPVLSVLIRAVAIEAPHLGATLHSAAALAVDERPDGAWHAEWGPLLRLLRRVVVAAAQTEEVLTGLVVDPDAMRRNVEAVGPALVSERLLREIAQLPRGASALSALRPALVGGAKARHLMPLLRAYLPADVLSDDAIADLLDPAAYLGAAGPLVDRAVSRHRAPGRRRPPAARPVEVFADPSGARDHLEPARIQLTLTQLRTAEQPGGLLLVGPSLGTAVAPLWSACASLLPADLEIVGWDLPGHGASAPFDQPFSVHDLAHILVEATAGLRAAITGPVLYAGVSLGGAVGLALAIEHGQILDGVVSIASGAKIGEPDGWHERAELVRTAGTPVMVDGSAKRWFAPGSIERDPATAAALLGSLQDADRFSYARCCDALAAFDVRAELGRIEIPVLALAGEHDQAAPVELSELVAAGTGGSLRVIVDAAHLPPAEQPAAVAREIADFITSRVAESRAS